ncbi:hypothetical protein [Flexivirga meconopsidis]|uniref:hypothetical protein n=1 Tax=Flexivirga meconopsidis TaxID=2977121 RepID=UPI0022409737|nr:hypothetical protein [Flexivirga meconopsidis]
MTATVMDRGDVRTTDGTLALANLTAQVDMLVGQALPAGSPDSAAHRILEQQATLVDLLTLRGHLLGCVADYERAFQVADRMVATAPHSAIALSARARTRATLHRFADAWSDLDAAHRAEPSVDGLDADRSAILQAVGCYEEAELLLQNAASQQSDFASLSAQAVLYAERGSIAEAVQAFAAAHDAHRGVSPFPLAQLDFRRGVMWMREGDLTAAHEAFDAARRRVPAYAPATGHLAEIELLRGNAAAAAGYLRPVAETSDDPEYAAHLVLALRGLGQHDRARVWRDRAKRRYDELVRLHPEAYADHAGDFWLGPGGDPGRALRLAQWTLVMRQTPRARAVVERARAAVGASSPDVR